MSEILAASKLRDSYGNEVELIDGTARQEIERLSGELDGLKGGAEPFEMSGNIVRCEPTSGTQLTVTTDADVTVYSCGRNMLGMSAGNTGTITVNGITFTFEEDGSVTLNGTPEKDFWPVLYSTTGTTVKESAKDYGSGNMLSLPEAQYYFSVDITGTATGGDPKKPSIGMYMADGTLYNHMADAAFEPGQVLGVNSVFMGCYLGITYENFNVRFQLEAGSMKTEYEKFKGRRSVNSDGNVRISGIDGEYTVWASSGEVNVSGIQGSGSSGGGMTADQAAQLEQNTADIEQLSADVETLYGYVESATEPFEMSGNIVRCEPARGTQLTVASDEGVTVYSCGKNMLGMSPSNTGTITRDGVTFTFEEDGSVTLNGTPTKDFYPVLYSTVGKTVSDNLADYGSENMFSLPEAQYYFSTVITGSATGGDAKRPSIGVYLADGTIYNYLSNIAFNAGEILGVNSVFMGCYAAVTYENFNIRFQLEVGNTQTKYEPHVTVKETESDGSITIVDGLSGERTVWTSSGEVTVSGEKDGGEALRTGIPFYWKSYIDEKIETIKDLHRTLGKDCFSFVAMADLHYPQNLGKRSPSLAKKIMDECGIPYLLCLGDMASSNAVSDKEDFLADNDGIEAMFEPVRSRTLFVLGNHDGAYGTYDADGDGVIDSNEAEMFVYNLTPAELHQWLFRRSCQIGGVHFDESGTAYYVDDTANRTRYIILNTQCHDYELNENGTVKYNVMRKFCFTQKQYDFLIEEALVGLTDRWHVVVGAHIPLANGVEGSAFGDIAVMRNLLTAYRNKTTYATEYAGTAENGYDSASINADFTAAKGNFVGYFAGHLHDGYHYANAAHGIDMIGIPCDRSRDGMTAGTVTEQSFDVVTVDTKNKKIYCTKIGFGEDREISYA